MGASNLTANSASLAVSPMRSGGSTSMSSRPWRPRERSSPPSTTRRSVLTSPLKPRQQSRSRPRLLVTRRSSTSMVSTESRPTGFLPASAHLLTQSELSRALLNLIFRIVQYFNEKRKQKYHEHLVNLN